MNYSAIYGLATSKIIRKVLAKLLRNQLTVITYHAVLKKPLPVKDYCFIDEERFIDHLHYLKKNYNVVSLADGIELLRREEINSPTVSITFDDGFQNNYDVAFPLLQQFKLPATIFLTTKYIDSEDTVWFCKINYALTATNKTILRWHGEQYLIDSLEMKSASSYKIQNKLKRLTPMELKRELSIINGNLNVKEEDKINVDSPYRMLSLRPIKEMLKSTLIEFGSHTHSHVICSTIDRHAQENEIQDSISKVEEITQMPCRYFAYPNGAVADFDNHTVDILKKSKISSAFTTIPGPNVWPCSLYRMKRQGIDGSIDFSRFRAKICHINLFGKSMLIHHLREKLAKKKTRDLENYHGS